MPPTSDESPLVGGTVPMTRSPPVTGLWPEHSADLDAVLRQTMACRRYDVHTRTSSGEANPQRSWCFPPVSALLDGVALFGIRPPPASECWPELSADSQAVLRLVRSPRKTAFSPRTISGEANPNRSWCFPPLSAFLNGVGLFGIRLPPITGS